MLNFIKLHPDAFMPELKYEKEKATCKERTDK